MKNKINIYGSGHNLEQCFVNVLIKIPNQAQNKPDKVDFWTIDKENDKKATENHWKLLKITKNHRKVSETEK